MRQLPSQRKVKRRALLDRGLRPHAAAVAPDDVVRDGQPDADAGTLRRRVEAMEGLEESVCIFHGKTRSVVAYKVRLVPVGLGDTEFDLR